MGYLGTTIDEPHNLLLLTGKANVGYWINQPKGFCKNIRVVWVKKIEQLSQMNRTKSTITIFELINNAT